MLKSVIPGNWTASEPNHGALHLQVKVANSFLQAWHFFPIKTLHYLPLLLLFYQSWR